jgi:hypothetical protein
MSGYGPKTLPGLPMAQKLFAAPGNEALFSTKGDILSRVESRHKGADAYCPFTR